MNGFNGIENGINSTLNYKLQKLVGFYEALRTTRQLAIRDGGNVMSSIPGIYVLIYPIF